MKNMSRFNSFCACLATVVAAASCSNVANVDVQIENAPSVETVVKVQDVNKYTVLDTLTSDASGKLSFKVKLEEGQPEFVYIFMGEKKLASLILQAGDKVSVKADTLGNYEVSGSLESEKLAPMVSSMITNKELENGIAVMDMIGDPTTVANVKGLELPSGDERLGVTTPVNFRLTGLVALIPSLADDGESLHYFTLYLKDAKDNVLEQRLAFKVVK